MDSGETPHSQGANSLSESKKTNLTLKKPVPLGNVPNLVLHLDQLFDLERALLLYTAPGSDSYQDGKRSIPAPRSLP